MNNQQAVKTLKRMKYAAVGTLMLSYGVSRLSTCRQDFNKIEPKTEKMTASQRFAFEEKKVMAMPLQLGKPCVEDTADKIIEIIYVMKDRDTLYCSSWNGGVDETYRLGSKVLEKMPMEQIEKKSMAGVPAGADIVLALKMMEDIPCEIKPYPNWKIFFLSNVRDFVIDEKPLRLCPTGDSAFAEALPELSKVHMNPWNIEKYRRTADLMMVLVHEAGHIYTYQKSRKEYCAMNLQDNERQAERFQMAFLHASMKNDSIECEMEILESVKESPKQMSMDDVSKERLHIVGVLAGQLKNEKKNVLWNSISYDKLAEKAEYSRVSEVFAEIFALASLAIFILISIGSIALAWNSRKERKD